MFKDYFNSVVCQSSGSSSKISHYTAVEMDPMIFDTNIPDIGLKEASITTVSNNNGGRNITCTFKRDNIKPSILNPPNGTRYIEIGQDSSFYVLSAFGSGKLLKHIK